MAFQTTQRPAFGRRITPQAQPTAATQALGSVAASPPVPANEETEVLDDASVDQELQAWKEARGSRFQMPWQQIYLMASLCFGIASFVLPDWMSDGVDYLLWILCGLSALAWYNGRKKKADVKAPAAP
jgi:hypothetical protein